MIIDDLADLFTELQKNNSHKEIARHFDRERKFVISMKKWLRISFRLRIYCRTKAFWI